MRAFSPADAEKDHGADPIFSGGSWSSATCSLSRFGSVARHLKDTGATPARAHELAEGLARLLLAWAGPSLESETWTFDIIAIMATELGEGTGEAVVLSPGLSLPRFRAHKAHSGHDDAGRFWGGWS